MTLLAVDRLHAGYGRTPALFGVDLRVEAGEIVALLGRNGVGKTTTLRSIVGQTTRTEGSVKVDGAALERLPTQAIARMGVEYVPEDRGVFPGLTVAENLRLGRLAGGVASDEPHAIARFPVLGERLDQDAGALSGGERQMLALGRALLARPRLLLIDEFSEGLQPNLVQELAGGLGEITASGVGVLLVEQNAHLALRVSARCYVIEKGVVVDEGISSEFLTDEARLREHLVV